MKPLWRIDKETSGSGVTRWIVAGADDARASFDQVLGLLEGDAGFVDAWSEALIACPMQAYCWECPPFQATTMSRPFECVLVESPLLERAEPDPAPFAEYFRADREVVVFAILGKDATLIAPCPRNGRDFAHLGRFMRNADTAQRRALWRQVSISARRAVGREPIWLSTAGLGVSWLHVRLDTRPKYYRYAPYRMALL